MRVPASVVLTITTLLLPFALAGTAHADDTPVAAPAAVAPDVTDNGAAALDAATRDDALGPAVSVDALAALRGGTDTVTQTIDLRGTVDGNSVNDSVTGTNLVQGGSFGNAAGISTVIQNSGNNVLIQNSTTVSVLFAPAP